VATDAVAELAGLGAAVAYCRADVTSADDRAAMVDAIRQRFGQLDVLVNNAGVAPRVRADILEADEESWDFVLGVNLRGPYFLTQAVANWMVEQSKADDGYRGCIVNICSISSTVASVNRGDYCVSKAGVSMATKLWAARLGEFGIDVYEIRPGIIATDMTAGVKDKYDKLIAEGLTLEPRWGTSEDIGAAVAILATGELKYATGQVLIVDGGMTLQRL
jgi:NAD(P)-dependent dehydrogenase (short-subunit alcohol dehydrogenase family)